MENILLFFKIPVNKKKITDIYNCISRAILHNNALKLFTKKNSVNTPGKFILMRNPVAVNKYNQVVLFKKYWRIESDVSNGPAIKTLIIIRTIKAG